MEEKLYSTDGRNTDGANADGSADNVAPRKPWKAPMLAKYGSVTLLTQAGASGTAESGSTRTCRKSSDFGLKENINRIGEHPLGFGLYLFDYKPAFQAANGRGRQFGVLAQEVEQIMPSAVSLDAAGFKVVDYASLGIQPIQR